MWAYDKELESNPAATLLIVNCVIHNIIIDDSLTVYNFAPSAIGIILHQQKCYISIINVTVQNIRSIRMPLLSVSTASFDTTIVRISNSIFNNSTVASVLTMVNSGNASVSLSMKNNRFCNNTVYEHLVSLDNVVLQLQKCTLFDSNIANTVLKVNKYVSLHKKATLHFSNNRPNSLLPVFNRFVIEIAPQKSNKCPFQFNAFPLMPLSYIKFCNNKGYYREIYIHSFLFNCSWVSLNISSKHLFPEILYKYTLHLCGNETRTIKFGWENHAIHCDGSPGHLLYTPPMSYFPGQTIITKLQRSKTKAHLLLHTDFIGNPFYNIAPICKLSHYYFRKPKLFMVSSSCTELTYTVEANASTTNTCLILLRESQDLTFVLNVSLSSSCPPAFSLDHYANSCKCSDDLQRDMKGIACNISNVTIKPPRHSWISVDNGNEVIYTMHCKFDYCSYYPRYIELHKPNDQCVPTRGGISCGYCIKGLSTIFGSAKCKRCSNFGLFLIILFAIAGIALVILLFLLDLTVAKGDIYGFIFFMNALSVNSSEEFAMRSVIVSLCNLDLGIAACFYNGMTAYAATWLEMVFPVYVLMITAGLVFASRHSSMIEKLTRRKVIPVMATLFLLSYNKIMVVTFNGLFSYTFIYHLNSKKTEVYWATDTGISLFGAKHLMLFIVCAILLLFVIIPINALLLFTKQFYRFSIVVKYLKPYLDAYQAPFKDNYQYFLGLDCFLRAVVYIVDHIFVQDDATIYISILTVYIIYISWFQPFKSRINTLLYLLYMTYLMTLCVLFLHFSVLTVKPKEIFITSFRIVALVAFAQFLLILLYHIYKYVLCHHRVFIKCRGKFSQGYHNVLKHFTINSHSLNLSREMSPSCGELPPDSVRYDEFREELLTYEND